MPQLRSLSSAAADEVAAAGRARDRRGAAPPLPTAARRTAAPRPRLLLLLAALTLAALPAARARVTFATLLRDDRALIPLAPDFGFGAEGRIDVKLRGELRLKSSDYPSNGLRRCGRGGGAGGCGITAADRQPQATRTELAQSSS